MRGHIGQWLAWIRPRLLPLHQSWLVEHGGNECMEDIACCFFKMFKQYYFLVFIVNVTTFNTIS